MRQINGTYYTYILSASRAEYSALENLRRSAGLADELNLLAREGVTITEACGFYEGREETSYVVQCLPSDAGHVEGAVAELARAYDQDCYLVQTCEYDEAAELVYCEDGSREKLDGRLRQVENVDGLSGWTEVAGVYYAITD